MESVKLNEMIKRLEELRKEHGGDANVQVFTSTDGDDVRAYNIFSVHDGWFYNEKGDVICIEIDISVETKKGNNVYPENYERDPWKPSVK